MRSLPPVSSTQTTINYSRFAVLALALWLGNPARAATPSAVTLDQAVSHALAHHPDIERARAAVEQARAELVGAETYPFNPRVEASSNGRFRSGESALDFELGVSQPIELGGKRKRRIAVARTDLERRRADLVRAQRVVVAQVTLAYADAWEADALLAVAQAEQRLAAQLLDLTRQRLAEGQGTRLDVNVAAARMGRIEQRVALAAARALEARAMLAAAMGLAATALPRASQGPPAALPRPPALENAVQAALQHRADLDALRRAVVAARRRIELERANVWRELEVGVFGGLEDRTDVLAGVRLGLELPVIQRNQGGIARARADERTARAEVARSELDVQREVVALWERREKLAHAAEILATQVLGTVEENIGLVRRAFDAGEVGWTDVLVMQTTLFDGQRALVEVKAALWRASIRLALATGTLDVPTPPNGQEETP